VPATQHKRAWIAAEHKGEKLGEADQRTTRARTFAAAMLDVDIPETKRLQILCAGALHPALNAYDKNLSV
jgi:hypothetical protein